MVVGDGVVCQRHLCDSHTVAGILLEDVPCPSHYKRGEVTVCKHELLERAYPCSCDAIILWHPHYFVNA